MRALRGVLVAAGVSLALSHVAAAQTAAYPPAGYSPLLFDAADTKYVFRLNGTPWICRGDTFCKPLKVDGVADKDLAQATIESLGYAGARYFLSYRQANLEKGKEVVLACTEERCSKLDAVLGDASPMGIYRVKQGDRTVTRAALLRQNESRNGRAQLLWCSEKDCSELPLTRDAELYLAPMGSGRDDNHAVAWLRDKSGAILSCAQPEEGVSDQLACEKTKMVLSDFPAAAVAPAAAPAPPPAPPKPAPAAPQPNAAEVERNNLSAAIDKAIMAGDFAGADRLLADATKRHAGNGAWPPLQQKLAKARADHEARRLIVEARRAAQSGDFARAEATLKEAERVDPGFAEIAQARTEIASLRTDRGQRGRERSQYLPAIDQALSAGQLGEAERLLADYAQRFAQDDEYRARANRLAQLRRTDGRPPAAAINEARAHIQAARQAAQRGDSAEAERQLVAADRAAPGFPEVAQARAELSQRPGFTITIPGGLGLPSGNQAPAPAPAPPPRN